MNLTQFTLKIVSRIRFKLLKSTGVWYCFSEIFHIINLVHMDNYVAFFSISCYIIRVWFEYFLSFVFMLEDVVYFVQLFCSESFQLTRETFFVFQKKCIISDFF